MALEGKGCTATNALVASLNVIRTRPLILTCALVCYARMCILLVGTEYR